MENLQRPYRRTFFFNPFFVELTPINHNFDEELCKEISTTPLKSFDFPSIVYMVIIRKQN